MHYFLISAKKENTIHIHQGKRFFDHITTTTNSGWVNYFRWIIYQMPTTELNGQQQQQQKKSGCIVCMCIGIKFG